MAAIFGVAALLWVFREDLNLGAFIVPGWSRLHPALSAVDDSTLAISLALLLFLIPARPEPGSLLAAATFARVPWDVLLLFGGGFALAAGFTASGLSTYLAGALKALGHVPEFVALLIVCTMLTFLTELTSNVATATMFLPVLDAWAVAEGLHPMILMMPATLSASKAFMSPVATPPNAVVFSSRRVRNADMARVGVVLNLIVIVVIAAFSQWILPLVMDFGPNMALTWDLPPVP